MHLASDLNWSRIGFASAALELFGLSNARAVFDNCVELTGLMLYPVVVVVEVVDVMNVVVMEVGTFQCLASTQVLLTAESILIYAWLIFLSVLWYFGWCATERSDLGSGWDSRLGGWTNHLDAGSWGHELSSLSIGQLLGLLGNVLSGSELLGDCLNSDVALSLFEFSLFDWSSNGPILSLFKFHGLVELHGLILSKFALDGCQFLLTNVFEESVLFESDLWLNGCEFLGTGVNKSVWCDGRVLVGAHHDVVSGGSPWSSIDLESLNWCNWELLVP